jgi:uncharacterized protein YceK
VNPGDRLRSLALAARFACGPASTVLALTASLGCMTIDTQRDAGYHGPWVYSGVRKDAEMFPDAFLHLSGWALFVMADFPFSAIADTVILPVTIPKDRVRDQEIAADTEVSTERPSPIEPVAGEDAVATAQRLFDACAKLLHKQDPHFSDCYSVDAEVEIAGGATFRGADYKTAVRGALARDVAAGQLVEWRTPTFTADGARVRIDATRASSSDPPRSPVVLEVGACADGAWRIVSEHSVGWAAR